MLFSFLSTWYSMLTFFVAFLPPALWLSGRYQNAIHLQRVVGDAKVQQFAHHTLYLLDAWITKFHNFLIHTDDMIMLLSYPYDFSCLVLPNW